MKYYLFILVLATSFIFNACKVGNKDIPTPTTNQVVDTTGGTANFSLSLSGDTAYTLHIKILLDTVLGDTLSLTGLDAQTLDQIVFATNKDTVGTYKPFLPQGLFIFAKKKTSGYTNIAMTQGEIQITDRDLTTGIYKGYINVNNNNVSGQAHYTISGNFVMKN